MTLLVEPMSFAQRDRDAWEQAWRTQSACEMFADLRPSFLTQIIAAKAIVRPKRFFGEAYVAGRWGYDKAWYSSYKWLTSPIWTDGKCPGDEWHQKFKAALHDHFPRLAELQKRALALEAELGFKPVAPDLWLIRRDEHWFIETKIPPDHLAESQLAGMALIATCLPAARQVRVAIVYLQEESAGHHRIPAETRHRFETYCTRLRRSNKLHSTAARAIVSGRG